MSAAYPLVKNLSAFSTRCGVRTSPSRSGFSPSSDSTFLMRSCILLFYISVSAAAAIAQTADSLYADRANLASARRAFELWTEALTKDPASFEAAWKLARVDYWLGGHAAQEERRRFLENGIEAARKALALEPGRPEGHFWATGFECQRF